MQISRVILSGAALSIAGAVAAIAASGSAAQPSAESRVGNHDGDLASAPAIRGGQTVATAMLFQPNSTPPAGEMIANRSNGSLALFESADHFRRGYAGLAHNARLLAAYLRRGTADQQQVILNSRGRQQCALHAVVAG